MANNHGKNSGPHSHKWCAFQEPYPEPNVVNSNHYYAGLLLEDYAGTVSEMTAINQYLYHYFTFKDFSDMVEMERCIAIVEMHHMDLLGDTITLLGVNPEFRTLTMNMPVYWNAAYVYYGTNVCDKLAADIAAEVQAIQNYRHHQQLIEDPYIKALLERIIKDEEYHYHLFTEAYYKYCSKTIQ